MPSPFRGARREKGARPNLAISCYLYGSFGGPFQRTVPSAAFISISVNRAAMRMQVMPTIPPRRSGCVNSNC
jgi:hypothetical protein